MVQLYNMISINLGREWVRITIVAAYLVIVDQGCLLVERDAVTSVVLECEVKQARTRIYNQKSAIFIKDETSWLCEAIGDESISPTVSSLGRRV